VGATGFVAALGWSAGVATGLVVHLPVGIVALGALAAVVALMLSPHGSVRLASTLLLALLIGVARATVGSSNTGGEALAGHSGEVVIVGRVLDAPVSRGSRIELDVAVETVADASAAASPTLLAEPRPRLLVRAATASARYGDRVEARGRLAQPRSRPGWPLAEILARRRIFWVLDTGLVRARGVADAGPYAWLASAHDWLDANVRLWLPEPTGSLVSGVVLGARSGLPPELRAILSTTGTTHLTAVSGFNVAIVAGGLLAALQRLGGRRLAIVPTLAGVWVYALLVGAPPSALRAAAMVSVALAAQATGRLADPAVGLALAVAALLGWDPALAFDLGFQLSIAATAGLILLSPALEAHMPRRPGWLRGQLAVALAAQLATLPILLSVFQTVSLVALPANLVVAPLVLPLTWIGVALAFAAPLPGIGLVLGWAAWLTATALLAIVGWFAQLPGAALATGRPSPGFALCWYLMLVCWVGARSADVRALGLRPRPLLGVAVVAGLAAGVLAVAPIGASGAVEISILDVDAGAAFVRSPNGRAAVVLTDDNAYGLTASVAERLHGLGDLPSVVVAPAGAVAVADLIRRYPAAAVLAGGPPSADEHAATGAHESSGDSARPGTRVVLDDRVTIEVIDVRVVDERTVLDLVIRADGLVVWLPGPGPRSPNWSTAISQERAVLRLPSTATAWVREGLPQRWLLFVAQGARLAAADLGGHLLLDQRRYGAVEFVLTDGVLDVHTERCDSGSACQVTVPEAASDARIAPSTVADDELQAHERLAGTWRLLSGSVEWRR
jgi:competence protein ComEC